MNNHLNLEKFCDSAQPALARPFSFGDWTIASNNHIAVRVPRRPDIAENPDAPNDRALKLFEQVGMKRRYRPAPAFELTEPFEWNEEFECATCRGDGKMHACPDCKCKCQVCDGAGKQTIERFRTITLGRAHYQAKYLSWLQPLPGLQLGPTHRQNPLAFRFDGGEGLLLPCRMPG
jgi:hypothetical protein